MWNRYRWNKVRWNGPCVTLPVPHTEPDPGWSSAARIGPDPSRSTAPRIGPDPGWSSAARIGPDPSRSIAPPL